MHLLTHRVMVGLGYQQGYPGGLSAEVLVLPLMLKLSIAMGELKTNLAQEELGWWCCDLGMGFVGEDGSISRCGPSWTQ